MGSAQEKCSRERLTVFKPSTHSTFSSVTLIYFPFLMNSPHAHTEMSFQSIALENTLFPTSGALDSFFFNTYPEIIQSTALRTDPQWSPGLH